MYDLNWDMSFFKLLCAGLSETLTFLKKKKFFCNISFKLKTKYHGFIFHVCYVSVPFSELHL